MKEFYQEFLELIRDRITEGDVLFTEFKEKLDGTGNFDLSNPKKFTKTEERLLSEIRSALNTIFGYTGFTLLQMGIMTFNEVDGNFKIEFIIPDFETLTKILNTFLIRPINAKLFGVNYDDTFLNDLRNRPRLLLPILFSGQMQLVMTSSGSMNVLYTHPSLDFIENIFPDFTYGVQDSYYHSEAYNLMYNTFYSSFAGREKFGQRIADAKIKLMDILFSDVIDTQIIMNTLSRYAPFSTMSEADQKIWLELMQMYYRVALADALMLPRRYFDPTSILFDMITGVFTSESLTSALRITGKINNEMAKNYELNFGVLLSKLTTEEIRQISPALFYTYGHLFGSTSDAQRNLNNYRTMATDSFWRLVEAPIEHTVSQLENILTSVGSESFVVQFRRLSHAGINKDKSGSLKERVYNSQDLSDSKITDYNAHPEIQGSNILITDSDIRNQRRLRDKLFTIVYYMVKYQAFIVVKAESAQKTDVILAGTLTELFTLDYIRSLTSDGDWGALTLTEDADDNYRTWQEDWNRIIRPDGEIEIDIWNDGNAYIPFYLLLDYKSGADLFSESEGRLKDLFLERFGVNVEHLTRRLSARTT